MTLKTKKGATYEDIEALPPGWVGEIVDGTLYGHPRPAVGHVHAATELGHLLMAPYSDGAGGPGGWWFLDEPELHFGREVFVPDLAGWRKDRMPRRPQPQEPYLTLEPDWICEILSPSTASVDRVHKLSRYRELGVSFAWIIDPLGRSLEVMERDERGWVTIGAHMDDSQVRARPFDELLLPLGKLWLK